MAGKGSSRRPTDNTAFSTNYDAIWGNKPKDKQAEPEATIQQQPPTKKSLVKPLASL